MASLALILSRSVVLRYALAHVDLQVSFADPFQVSTGQYQHKTFRFITMMRGGLISMLYGKATEISLNDVDTASSLTLMSADIERIVMGMETGHEVRCSVFRFLCFLGVCSMLASILLTRRMDLCFFIRPSEHIEADCYSLG